MLFLLLPLVLADSSDLNSGELVSDATINKEICNQFSNEPSFCLIELESKSSDSVEQEEIDSLLNMPLANKELSEAEIIGLRSDNATDRLIALYELFSSFWVILFQLVSALFVFLEVYIVLWVLFVGIPKFLNYIIELVLKAKV